MVESAHGFSRTILHVYAPVPFVVSSSRRQLAEVAFNTTLNFREGTASVLMLSFIERMQGDKARIRSVQITGSKHRMSWR